MGVFRVNVRRVKMGKPSTQLSNWRLVRRGWRPGAGSAAIVFLVFFVAYRWGLHLRLLDHFLHLETYDFYSKFQRDSDELVIQRFEQNRLGGVFSGWILPGNELEGHYSSEFGLGCWLLTIVPTILGLHKTAAVSLMYTVVTASHALLATTFVLRIRRQLSLGASALAWLALMQPWSAAIAKSIYQLIGLRILPALALMLVLRSTSVPTRRVVLSVFCASLFVFLSGYAFLTLVAALPLAVLAYHSTINSWQPRRVFNRLVSVSVGITSGLFIALALHFLQLYYFLGSFERAGNKLVEIIAKRTSVVGGAIPPEVAESVASSPGEILRLYLSMPVFGAVSEGLPTLTGYFRVDGLIVLCGVFTLFVFRKRDMLSESDRKERGLALAWTVSTLGPICWFLLARPHSYIHDHLNFALWFLPTIPLGLALMWGPISAGVRGLKGNPVASCWITGVLLAIALSFLYSLVTVRP